LIADRNQTFIASIYHREMDSASPKLRQPSHPSRLQSAIFPLFVLISALAFTVPAGGQDQISGGINSGVSVIRIAVADFKPLAADAQTSALKQTFDATFYADLANAGIFDIVSKSLLPPASPGAPSEVKLQSYSDAPANAAFVSFGSIAVVGSKLIVNGFLFDAKNTQYPQVLAKQYSEDPSEQSARTIAHRFADEIILRLGGGTPGIAESTIYFVKLSGGGNKEIWAMDYDGANQRQITHLGTISISPRISPDNSRLAFESLGKNGFQIKIYSMILGRLINFPEVGDYNITPAWSPDGREIAFSSSRTGDPEIWISDAGGNLARRITNFRGPDVAPTYNPKTGAQIAWISGRTGLPQLYIMNSDGSGPQRLTDMGYATSPSWSPDGQFITFAWDRKYGPGAPGGQDIYVIQTTPNAKGEYPIIQLTYDGGRCDFPSWSPDGKHIVYANSADGRADHMRIWTMLADGRQRRPLTGPGADMPNWSWK